MQSIKVDNPKNSSTSIQTNTIESVGIRVIYHGIPMLDAACEMQRIKLHRPS